MVNSRLVWLSMWLFLEGLKFILELKKTVKVVKLLLVALHEHSPDIFQFSICLIKQSMQLHVHCSASDSDCVKHDMPQNSLYLMYYWLEENS